MKWDDLLEEEVSKKHTQNVQRAVAPLLEQQKKENYVPFWQRWHLLPAATFAAFGALSFVMLRNLDEQTPGTLENAGEDMDLLLSVNDDLGEEEFEILEEDIEFFENLEVLEKWDA